MKIITAKTFTNSLFLTVVLTACGGGPKPVENGLAEVNELSQQTVNAVLWYNTSAENVWIYEQTYNIATVMTEQNIGTANKEGLPNAVVLDIDETVLDNSPYMLGLIKQGEQFSEESWAAWVMKSSAKPLPGVEDYLRFCEEQSIEVFYISNRSRNHLEYTLQNMMNYNLPFADEAHVFLKGDESDKSERREFVESQHNVLLYIGDNLLDFDRMYQDRKDNYGKGTVDASFKLQKDRYLLLPNPMYGQWEKVFNLEGDLTPNQKAKKKIDLITVQDSK